MSENRFTIIDDGRVCEITASVTRDGVRLAPVVLKATLGWELKPQGLCKEALCVPVGAQQGLVTEAGIDLQTLAVLLARPLAIDMAERAAYLGASAADRSAQLASLEAPDFTLPDLDGKLHALSDYRGKKVLLVAYASW